MTTAHQYAGNGTQPPPFDSGFIHIPMNGIMRDINNGYNILFNGHLCPVVWFSDVSCWFLLEEYKPGHFSLLSPIYRAGNGEWIIAESPAEARRCSVLSDIQYTDIQLPPIPPLPSAALPLPTTVHYIWTGDQTLPEYLLKRMRNSATRCPAFRFILHAHPTTKKAWRRLQKRSYGRIILSDLRRDESFIHFLDTEAGSYYQRFLRPPHVNFGAAADLLRYFILSKNGGVYMDVDDEIITNISLHYRLMADRHTVLLNSVSRILDCDTSLYTNSSFACHAGNHAMSDLLKKAVFRLRSQETLLQAQRPWCTSHAEIDSTELRKYTLSVIRLTGPGLFSDIIENSQPLSYHLERDRMTAFRLLNAWPGRPCIIADNYEEQMQAAANFFIPFAGPDFFIKVGSTSSWNFRHAVPPDNV